MSTARLSVVIASFNEAGNIRDCLASAAWADECLVIDSGSSDDTVALARAAGARVICTDWPGYGPQQNRAIDAASGDWIYSLDADERITPALAAEIRAVLAAPAYAVYKVPRRSLLVTRFMRHSGWWPDYTKRLFRRGSARFTDHEIHAHLATHEAIGQLQNPMLHYSYRRLDQLLEKINRYSAGSARDLHARGRKGSLGGAIRHGLWAFLRTYFIKLGVLDGAMGFVLAVANAESAYYKHLKLAELQGRLGTLESAADARASARDPQT